ncbi:Uncharacterized protein, possibly involved in tellurite resistance [Sphingobium faniae]|nr:Uncharacterized protein, possibly involved in tellurite resistance [Sphingobium faniae]
MSAQIPRPYRSTPVFDQDTLPAALRRDHSTKAGVWGVIRVIEGRLRLTFIDPFAEHVLEAGDAAVSQPQQAHFVTPDGAMKMQVDFYDRPPGG